MPTTALTVTDGPHPYSVHGVDVNMQAADAGNGNHFVASASQLVIVRNSGASSRTVTITSQPLPVTQRSANVAAEPLAAGELRVFLLPDDGWKDSATGKILISASHAEVLIGIIDLTKQVLTA